MLCGSGVKSNDKVGAAREEMFSRTHRRTQTQFSHVMTRTVWRV